MVVLVHPVDRFSRVSSLGGTSPSCYAAGRADLVGDDGSPAAGGGQSGYPLITRWVSTPIGGTVVELQLAGPLQRQPGCAAAGNFYS